MWRSPYYSIPDDPEEHERVCDLPYAVDYTPSSRGFFCHKCYIWMPKGWLRLCKRKIPQQPVSTIGESWYHYDCFWKVICDPHINESAFRGFSWLKWEDQERIREKLKLHLLTPNGAWYARFGEPTWAMIRAEHAKTRRGICHSCRRPVIILTHKFLWKSCWYHLECLLRRCPYIKGRVEDLKDFEKMSEATKQELRSIAAKQLPPILGAPNKPLPARTPDAVTPPADDEEQEAIRMAEWEREHPPEEDDETRLEKLKAQALLAWDLREKLKDINKEHLLELMKCNDIIAFETCNISAYRVMSLTVDFRGEKTSWACNTTERMMDRLVDAAMFGAPARCTICKTGSLVFSKSGNTYVCLGHISEWTKCTYTHKNPMRSPVGVPRELAKKCPALTQITFNSLKERTYPKELPVVKMPHIRRDGPAEMFERVSVKDNFNNGQMQSALRGKQIIKEGTIVDGECQYAENCHVYKDEAGPYSVVLGYSDVATNRNSYCKMQLLEHDARGVYYLFSSWGRVGTNLGGIDATPIYVEEQAVKAFETMFFDNTGNKWQDRKYFCKRPGKMALIEMGYPELDQAMTSSITTGIGKKSRLPRQIQFLMMLIFDLRSMKVILNGFELDLQRLPLGKISKQQIAEAHKVLGEILELINNRRDTTYKLMDASNRFYSIIPHNCGMNPLLLLGTTDLVKAKMKMLDDLTQISIAVSVMRQGLPPNPNTDPIDQNYLSLNVQMGVLDRSHPDFDIINTYVKRTHGSTHKYTVDVIDIFTVKRAGEEKKFKKDIGNRRLLWHGTKTVNFVGILTQGLRVAPPEASHAGYMFGKGIYFADMVTKSANYCGNERLRNSGIACLLLCEVALGNQQKEIRATHANNLKAGNNSVWGPGRFIPNKETFINHANGYLIPTGRPQKNPEKNMYLLYNEYIVYDPDQVCMRYLIRANMTFR